MKFFGFSRKKICFFDSGIGGLTLLHECSKALHGATFLYFADNYNVPYGNLPAEELSEKVDGIFSEIAKAGPDIAVIACNTVTAQCVERLRKKYPFPIVGIQPAVKEAVEKCGSCTVFATPATAGSESLRKLIENYGNGSVEVVACPDLAAEIERNIFNPDREKDIVNLLPDIKTSSVVLGCTHYIYIKDMIREKYNCLVFTGVEGTVRRILRLLGADTAKNEDCGDNNFIFIGGDGEKNEKVLKETLNGR